MYINYYFNNVNNFIDVLYYDNFIYFITILTYYCFCNNVLY